jgi:hypothetical protein
MTTYYCDCDLATGDNDGTTAANAWQTLQAAIDGLNGTQPTAGDTVLCKGTDSITAAIDMDGGQGTYDGGHLKFVGVNSSWENDGTQFVIDGGNNNINGITVNAKSFIWIENFKIHSCDGTAGFGTANAVADHWVFDNCWFHDNDGYGWYGANYVRYPQFTRCKFTANTATGCYRPGQGSVFCACQFSDNTGASSRGLEMVTNGSCFGCVCHNNGSDGVYLYGLSMMANCVFDGNAGHGANIGTVHAYQFVGCRFTNNAGAGKYGLYVGANCRPTLLACYFGNNAEGASNRYDILPVDGSTANTVTAGSETNHGYTNPASDDFNLDPAKAVNTYSIAIPLD